jgi:phosphatidylserine decarboxylase
MSALAVRLPQLHPEGRMPAIGAAAIGVLGLLTGLQIFFVLGGVAAIAIYLASRAPLRTVPIDDRLVLAPVDGIIESVDENAGIPSELGLSGQASRIRIGTAPWAPAPIRAPGEARLTQKIVRPGAPYVFATDADDPTLSRTYVRLETQTATIGMVFASGGFGPRTFIDAKEGDSIGAGAPFGHRRFGGWCDIYVQGDTTVEAVAGQTMIAGETVIAVAGVGEKPSTLVR